FRILEFQGGRHPRHSSQTTADAEHTAGNRERTFRPTGKGALIEVKPRSRLAQRRTLAGRRYARAHRHQFQPYWKMRALCEALSQSASRLTRLPATHCFQDRVSQAKLG